MLIILLSTRRTQLDVAEWKAYLRIMGYIALMNIVVCMATSPPVEI